MNTRLANQRRTGGDFAPCARTRNPIVATLNYLNFAHIQGRARENWEV